MATAQYLDSQWLSDIPIRGNLAFSTEGLEVGRDKHAPVSSDCFGKGHFAFNGTIRNMNVKYLTNK